MQRVLRIEELVKRHLQRKGDSQSAGPLDARLLRRASRFEDHRKVPQCRR